MLFNFFIGQIQVVVYLVFFLKLLREKVRISFLLLTSFMLNTLVYVVTFFVNPYFNHFIIILFCIIYGRFFLKNNNSMIKLIYFALLSVIICSFLGLLLLNSAILIFDNIGHFNNSQMNLFSFCTTILSLIIVICLPLERIPFLDETNQPVLFSVSFAFLLFGIYLILENFIYGPTVFNEADVKDTVILQIIGIIFLICIGFLSFTGYQLSKKKMAAEQRALMYDEMVKYTKQLEVLHDELASFRHDYLNILTSLSASIASRDIHEVEEVFNRTVMPTYQQIGDKSYEIMKLNKIHIPEIKSLLAVKLIESQQQGIQMVIHISAEIEAISVDLLTAVRAVAILLDNAVEAASQSAKKEILITIDISGRDTILGIKNSCQAGEIDLTLLNEKNHSSKAGERRGLGLHILQELVQTNKNLLLETEYEFPYFKQTLTFLDARTVIEQTDV